MFLNVSGFMWPMGEDWRRVATAADARLSALRMDRVEFAKKAGVDRKSVDNFLDGAVKPGRAPGGSTSRCWAGPTDHSLPWREEGSQGLPSPMSEPSPMLRPTSRRAAGVRAG